MIAKWGLFGVILTFICVGCCCQVKEDAPCDDWGTAQQLDESQTLVSGDWPDHTWYEMFNDAQLTEYVECGLRESPDLKSAQHRIDQAQQEAYIARSKLYPSLDAFFAILFFYLGDHGFDFLSHVLPSRGNFINLAGNFSYEIDFWARNRLAYEVALGEMQVKHATAQQASLALSVNIVSTYFDLQANLMKEQITEEILRIADKSLELTQLRSIHRIQNTMDVNQAIEGVAAIQQTLEAVREEITLGKNQLRTLMGLCPDVDLDVLPLWCTYKEPVEIPEHIGLELIARRPDLAIQKIYVSNAAKQLQISASGYLPSVNLRDIPGLFSLHFSELFKANSFANLFLPVFTQPIFHGGAITARKKADKAAFTSSVQQYHNTIIKAANEVISNITKVNSLDEQIEANNEEQDSIKDNYNLTYARYKHGIDSFQEVLSADQKYLSQRIKQVELQRQRLQAVVSTVQSLGGGFTAACLDTNE